MSTFGDFKGEARPIDDYDLPRVGHIIGVGEDHIHAVMDVEAAGGAFDRFGRPKMLFEPHIFWRELGAGRKRDQAANLGLARPSWKRDYPSDSYPRLKQAMVIDQTAALRSASWSLGQTMGFNHELCGFATVDAMVLAVMDDAASGLEAMINFIKNTGLDDELRREDWRGFAKGYNGAGYAANRYHLKLATAFAKWRKIPDTPWSPDMAANDNERIEAMEIVLQRGDKGAGVRALQTDLSALGFYTAAIDADFGPATETAVRSFQNSAGLTVDGWVGEDTLAAIRTALAARPSDPSALDHIEAILEATATIADRTAALKKIAA